MDFEEKNEYNEENSYSTDGMEIAYQNKDITSKMLAENLLFFHCLIKRKKKRKNTWIK